MQIITEDGQKVAKGDRVFNYYDGIWGVIIDDPDSEGWFRLRQDNGATKSLNGSRICTYEPCVEMHCSGRFRDHAIGSAECDWKSDGEGGITHKSEA